MFDIPAVNLLLERSTLGAHAWEKEVQVDMVTVHDCYNLPAVFSFAHAFANYSTLFLGTKCRLMSQDQRYTTT